MVLPHLLVTLLAQAPQAAPQIAVVVTQRSGPGMPAERAELIATKISDVLVGRGVDVSGGPKQSAAALALAGIKNPAECQGKRGCVSGLGRLLKVWGVLGVELADLDGTLAVHLELVDSEKGERRAQLDIVMPTKKAESDVAAQVMPIVVPLKEVLDAVQPAPPPKVVEPAPAPKPALAPPAPAAAEPEPVVAAAPSASKGSVVPMALSLGAGAASGVASVVFLIFAGQSKSQLDGAGFSITRAEAQAIADRANAQYTLALGFAVGAAALLVLGVVLGLAR